MKKKFKNLFWSLVCFSTAVTCAHCDEAKSRSFKITVEVKEESGSPVSDAQVTASKVILIQEKPLPVGEPVRVTGKTDASGVVGMLLESFNEPGGVSVSKSGYYTTTGSANWTQGKTDLEYSAFLPIVLKPIKKPIPLIARNNLRPRLPEFGVRYGFDLEKGESLPPLGNGRVADIEFTLSGHRIEHPDPNKEVIDFKVEISCPNEGDGFIEFLAVDTQEFSHGSNLVSAHEVPQGEFSRIITRTLSNAPDGKVGRLVSHKQKEGLKCCYFRVRTQKDSHGNILSAHYGKMYGPLEIRPALKRNSHDVSKGQGGFYIQYLYFNPTPNDRNVEFDPKRNLHPEGNVRHP